MGGCVNNYIKLLKTILDDNNKFDNGYLCQACQKYHCITAIFPCAHLCGIYCSQWIHICPICKDHIAGKVIVNTPHCNSSINVAHW